MFVHYVGGINLCLYACVHALPSYQKYQTLQALPKRCHNYQASGAASGKNFSFNNLINSLPIELHQFAETGENIPGGSFNDQQKYSYCGPGTRYEQRIREGYKGINELDSMCKLHDQFYNENINTQRRNLSDEALAIRADQIAANQNLDTAQRKDAKFLSGVMRTKARLGLGIGACTGKGVSSSKKTKNYKRRPGMKH